MPDSSNLKWAHRLRLTGFCILLLGLSSASYWYWFVPPQAALRGDPMMTGFDRAARWERRVMFGDMGKLIDLLDEAQEDLSQPDGQTKLIAALSLACSLGCLYIAGMLVRHHEDKASPGTQ